MSLIGLLRTEGPLTATKAAELLGESTATTSFHLRQLAKYGMAEEAPGGQGRERPWQATTMSTDVPDFPQDPELAAAGGMFRAVIAQRYFEWLRRWLEQRPDEPGQWQRADVFGDRLLYLTSDELSELGQKMRDLFDDYVDRTAQPDLRPPDSRLISVLQFAFPMIGHMGGPFRPQAGEDPTDEATQDSDQR
jgi:Helix-turn-helix domain